MTGPDLPGRAAMLGISARDLIALGELDRRIIAPPALESEGSVWRLRRWIDAGRPAADLTRLEFTGDDSVRALVVDVLRSIPTPVAWHAIEAVTWFEVGRRTLAWMRRAPTMRTLPGDVAHVIVIDGRTRDEDLRGIVAHEIGHSMHRAIVESAPPFSTLTERDVIAARVLLAKYTGSADDPAYERARWIGSRVANELLADRAASAWGIPHHGPDMFELRRHFAAVYDAGAALAAERDQDDLAAAIGGAP